MAREGTNYLHDWAQSRPLSQSLSLLAAHSLTHQMPLQAFSEVVLQYSLVSACCGAIYTRWHLGGPVSGLSTNYSWC